MRESMYCRITYFLEKMYYQTRIHGYPFDGFESLDLFHVSTNNHLLNFLEKVLSVSPRMKIRLASHLGRESLLRDVPQIIEIQKIHSLEIVEFSSLGIAPAPDASVLLYSGKIHPDPGMYKSSRKAFTQNRAHPKFIVHGDGKIYSGSLFSRIRRKILRIFLNRFVERRDREEQNLLARRMIQDPGYDLQHPPLPEKCEHENRMTLLKHPFLIEQCRNDATIIMSSRFTAQDEDDVYGSGCHFVEMTDERPDWNSLRETYQSGRLRNMKKVGLPPCDAFGFRPTALDVGCGTGSFCELLHKHGFRTLGIDLSENTIQIARQQYPHLEFKRLPAENISELGTPFDLVVLSHILEHVRDDAGFLEGLKRVIKEESFLYIEVPWMNIEALSLRPYWYRQKYHFREYSKLGLYSLVSGCGYKILAHEDSLADEGNEPYQFLLARIPSEI